MNAQSKYLEKQEILGTFIEKEQKLSKKLSVARPIAAIPGLLLIGAAIFESRMPWGTWQVGTLLMIAFLALATWHEYVRDKLDWLIQQRLFYRRMTARCERRWAELPPLSSEKNTSSYSSDLSKDIDLFGERSLFRWVSLCVTDAGAQTLAEWMTHRASTETIFDRQNAVRELQQQRSWREDFWDAAIGFRGCDTSPEKIAEWATEPPLFHKKPWIGWLTWAGPATVFFGLLAMLVGAATNQQILFNTGFILFLAGVALNLLLVVSIMGRVHDVFFKIGNANRELQSLATLIGLTEKLAPQAPMLKQIQADVATKTVPATIALKQLRRVMSFAGIQKNPLFFIPYWICQLLFLWDIRILERLQSWRIRYGALVPGWIGGLGRLEALSCAAAIADEYPDWAYPALNSSEPREQSQNRTIHVRAIAHPLLPDAARVPNDLAIDESKPMLLVTGSNMAGKSTLLRSLGINSVLARMGSPVCCTQWSGPNVEIASSIRVQDSLQDGVSFFMAELKRLRSIVDFAGDVQDNMQVPSLILLDEILQGTNSRERQIAVEHVLTQLVQLRCLVITSTHDLELANSPSIHATAQVVHFREHFETQDGIEVMRFDYKMRPGVTPTTNALKLLELVGLRS